MIEKKSGAGSLLTALTVCHTLLEQHLKVQVDTKKTGTFEKHKQKLKKSKKKILLTEIEPLQLAF